MLIDYVNYHVTFLGWKNRKCELASKRGKRFPPWKHILSSDLSQGARIRYKNRHYKPLQVSINFQPKTKPNPPNYCEQNVEVGKCVQHFNKVF